MPHSKILVLAIAAIGCLSFVSVFTPLVKAENLQTTDHQAYGSQILPPIKKWQGKSEALIQPSTNPWQTYSEKTQLTDTPNYQETVSYLNKLVSSDSRLKMISIGKSPQGRDIWMVIATKEGVDNPEAFRDLKKPTLLVQAGIHSGEIDGKDAGLMLLRDIVHGDKSNLIEKVNLLFVPILSVDAHERRSEFNRVNQRGPTSMGWRTNASNLNLNRDYAKLDTLELQHMIRAINLWKPDLYLDVHVTDGEDYQYDLTYGFNLGYADSPNIARWMQTQFIITINQSLSQNGHNPGPLTFGVDSMDFSKGIVGWTPSPRFSNGYGDIRQLPTVLIENHSLKPYKQRVLATYIFIEESLKLLANKGKGLIKATKKDQSSRPTEMVIEWETNQQKPDSMDYAGIEFNKNNDPLTGLDYIEWTGKPKTYKNLPIFMMNKTKQKVKVPKSFWIPPQYKKVIERLKIHGIKLKVHQNKLKIKATQLTADNHQFKPEPYEGRQMVSSTFSIKKSTFELPENTVEISTDQDLGRLAVALLDPRAPDSFFAWGFFNPIFQRTEYIESYVLVPMAKKLFAQNKALKIEFDKLKKTDEAFAKNQRAQMEWIYRHSNYYDKQHLVYPILMSY